jgi:hypothetical protein
MHFSCYIYFFIVICIFYFISKINIVRSGVFNQLDASIYTAVSAERTYGGVDFHRIGGAFVA